MTCPSSRWPSRNSEGPRRPIHESSDGFARGSQRGHKPKWTQSRDDSGRRIRTTTPKPGEHRGLQEQLTGASAQTLWILFAVVACMAIACANVATLSGGCPGGARNCRSAGAGRVPFPPRSAVVHREPVLAQAGSSLGLSLAWSSGRRWSHFRPQPRGSGPL